MATEILTYDGIDLLIIGTKEISRRHIYTEDRCNYLWTEWVFDVRTILNPQTFVAGVGDQLGQPPAINDPKIRSRLTGPRRSLSFSQDGNTVLQCPSFVNPPNGPTFQRDCQNGPIVEHFNLVSDVGGKSWIVEIRIIAKVRECAFVSRQDRGIAPLISNRFRRSIDTDEDYLSYVETTGECVFDSAWLAELGTIPDQYRVDLFQPMPYNCKRDHINVVQLSDGCTYRYSFRDQEKHFNTLYATRVECVQTEFFSQTSAASAAAGAAISSITAQANSVMNSLVIGNPIGIAATGIGGTIKAAVDAIAQTALGQIPKFHSHVIARAWGNRNDNKNRLLTVAMKMAFERINTIRNVELIIQFDRAGKYVEVQLTSRTGPEELVRALNGPIQILGPIAGLVAGIVASIPGIDGSVTTIPAGITRTVGNMTNNISGTEDSPNDIYNSDEKEQLINTINNFPILVGKVTRGNDPPPRAGMTKGTIICNLISQSLHDPCFLPSCPPAIFGPDGKPIDFQDYTTCKNSSSTGNQPMPSGQPQPQPPLPALADPFVGAI